MARTGERYSAARRVLVDQAPGSHHDGRQGTAAAGTRTWAAAPETSDAAVRGATGHGWNEWCDRIDDWPGHVDGHGAVAEWLATTQHVDSWWAQSVTVGWERITGRRLPHQRPDGTFSASKSKTMAIDGAALRALLLDDEGRADLFGGESIELRSRPTSNNVRLGMPLGTAEIVIDERDDGRVRITVAHERLEEYDDVARWKDFWAGWLDDLATV